MLRHLAIPAYEHNRNLQRKRPGRCDFCWVGDQARCAEFRKPRNRMILPSTRDAGTASAFCERDAMNAAFVYELFKICAAGKLRRVPDRSFPPLQPHGTRHVGFWTHLGRTAAAQGTSPSKRSAVLSPLASAHVIVAGPNDRQMENAVDQQHPFNAAPERPGNDARRLAHG